jgi:hypothetical protein
MVCIRIKDSAHIEYTNKKQALNKTSRHKSIIKNFIINEGKIQFDEELLETKIIPKKHKNKFYDIPFKYIKTCSGDSILFQDPANTLRVLQINDGWIQSVVIDDLTEDDDIIIYNNNDWAISSIERIIYFDPAISNLDLKVNNHWKTDEDIYKKLSGKLSRYMIKSINGIIINNIFLI